MHLVVSILRPSQWIDLIYSGKKKKLVNVMPGKFDPSIETDKEQPKFDVDDTKKEQP
jgi:hypothetical protein